MDICGSIEVKKEYGRYTVYLNNEFYSTCENRNEVEEEIEEIRRIYGADGKGRLEKWTSEN